MRFWQIRNPEINRIRAKKLKQKNKTEAPTFIFHVQVVLISHNYPMWPSKGVLVLSKKNNNFNTWLVISTHLETIRQIGSFPQIGINIKNLWNHHLDNEFTRTWISHNFMTISQTSKAPCEVTNPEIPLYMRFGVKIKTCLKPPPR